MKYHSTTGTTLLSLCIFIALFTLLSEVIFFRIFAIEKNLASFLQAKKVRTELLNDSLTSLSAHTQESEFYIIEKNVSLLHETMKRQFLIWHPKLARETLQAATIKLSSLTHNSYPIILFSELQSIYTCTNYTFDSKFSSFSLDSIRSPRNCTINEFLEQDYLNGNFSCQQNLNLNNSKENSLTSKSVSGYISIGGVLKISGPTLIITGGDIAISEIVSNKTDIALTLVSMTGSISIGHISSNIKPKFIYQNDLSVPTVIVSDNHLYPQLVERSLIGLYDPLL